MKIDNHIADDDEVFQDPTHFPCGQCGADLQFEPGTSHLHCDYCGHSNPIELKKKNIREYDLPRALHKLSQLKREK